MGGVGGGGGGIYRMYMMIFRDYMLYDLLYFFGFRILGVIRVEGIGGFLVLRVLEVRREFEV